MKKRSVKNLAMATLLAFTIAMLLFGCDARQENIANECVRIHIRANSNSQQDQSVKLAVRDEITAYLTQKLDGCTNKKDAVSILCSEKQNLVNIANNTLYAHGFDYKASIALKNEYFPDRQYDGYDFPEGYYDALIIYLGTGEGDNWWCVAFPPLCFVPDSQNGEKIVYKSWVKEWLDKLFG